MRVAGSYPVYDMDPLSEAALGVLLRDKTIVTPSTDSGRLDAHRTEWAGTDTPDGLLIKERSLRIPADYNW